MSLSKKKQLTWVVNFGKPNCPPEAQNGYVWEERIMS